MTRTGRSPEAGGWSVLSCRFILPSRFPVLNEHEVHLWRAALDPAPQRIQALQETLTPDEIARAARFRLQRDRDRFVAARGLLRAILGLYLNQDPCKLRFCYSAQGKPGLTNEFGGEALRFNLTHSDGTALYAFARCRDLGVDLERIHPRWTGEQVAEQFFTPGEAAALRGLPMHERQSAFVRLWTRKEAHMKARSEDLSTLCRQPGVPQMPTGSARGIAAAGDPRGSRWSRHELAVGPGYAAALVVEGRDWQPQCWQWPPLHPSQLPFA